VSYTVPTGPHSFAETMAIVDTRAATTTRIGHGLVDGGSFSPDSGQIAVSTDAGDVAVYDIGSRRIKPITHGGNSASPLWGPKWIAFARGASLWLIHGDGSGLHRVARLGVNLRPAAWTADGEHLLVGADSGAWLIDLDSGRARALRGVNGVGFGLSRDGRRILDCRGGGRLSQPKPVWLESIPLDGGRPTIIARGSCNASWNS
jgi:hypothetical protein